MLKDKCPKNHFPFKRNCSTSEHFIRIFRTLIKSSRGFLYINVKSKLSVLIPHLDNGCRRGYRSWDLTRTSRFLRVRLAGRPRRELPGSVLSALCVALELTQPRRGGREVECSLSLLLAVGPYLLASLDCVFPTCEPSCLDSVPNLAISREGSTEGLALSFRNLLFTLPLESYETWAQVQLRRIRFLFYLVSESMVSEKCKPKEVSTVASDLLG